MLSLSAYTRTEDSRVCESIGARNEANKKKLLFFIHEDVTMKLSSFRSQTPLRSVGKPFTKPLEEIRQVKSPFVEAYTI